ncbi:hypothetical protein BDV32DRAFT_134783 [Aspergillus pseudonomiae]|uniref:Uncharacterized protein n=1 Tax=Aspergillus pseudonomiae TaxID=1506151 RepID=A0A5N6IGC7_9EURO|nr:uncharacterized protein BDV37DRAFT_290751 [Aspergillus pseudonomiae]KAB8264879.1 hypothetical protein BDV32DRAFT_134783 [Aspergillus pseudonomiae]KAE8407465.1 hypothetical protein BDV37DRAFT_290751 [Aspergillus pseudonomiae]
MYDIMVVLTFLVVLIAGVFGFVPEKGGLQYERLVSNGCHIERSTVLTILLSQTNPIPLTHDLRDSQAVNRAATNSWWSSSFVHASDDHEYLIVAHVVLRDLNVSTALLRASTLDINDTEYYRQVSWLYNGSSRPLHAHNEPPGVATKYFGFVSVDPDNPLDRMRIWCITERVELNLTFQLSAPVILNGGTGTFPFGDEATFQWSMPAGITDGHFTVNRKFLTIDSARSLTWYDRQLMWPTSGPSKSNWTWFEIHLSEQTMSIWAWDTVDGQRVRFATVRGEPGIHQVLAVTEFTPSSRQWTSPCSKASYSLDWVVALADGTTLELSSVRDDQELCDEEGTIATYEGYLNVAGTRGGHPISAYGLVEIVPAGMIKKPS